MLERGLVFDLNIPSIPKSPMLVDNQLAPRLLE